MNARTPADVLLSVRGVEVRFGGIVALDGVSFDVERGVIAALIGPNGAGKTTLFNCLSRFYLPSAGDIVFDGKSILEQSPHRMAALGVGRTFQNLSLFGSLTVLDNVCIGTHVRTSGNCAWDMLRTPSARRTERRIQETAFNLLEDLQLDAVSDVRVADLPFGTQKRVELARALAAQPQLLLLDEPACGLNHEEVVELGQTIRRVRDAHKLTVLLVEHHMGLVMSVSERVHALNFGRLLHSGTPSEIQTDPAVVAAYLGEPA